MASITDRIDAITAIPQSHLCERPPPPKSVKIEISPRCNYRCGFCALRMRVSQPREDMDFVLFQRITTEMREVGVEEIGCFFLGESMMAPDLLERCIAWCKQDLQFPYVFLTTNGSMATPERIRSCMSAGLDSLKFSINAYDSGQFHDIMGVSPRLFDSALRHLKAARVVRDNGGFQCGVYASSIHFDGAQQEKMLDLLQKEVLPYVDEHYWLPLYSMGSFATQREEELGYRPIAGNQGRLGALRDPLPCWSAFTEGHVRADGHLSACCFGASDVFDIGNLNAHSFMDVWNNERFAALRRAHLDGDVSGTMCENCVAYT
jgi:MoaA/NifB/PqqE/SkfB family radical SAM enzyme